MVVVPTIDTENMNHGFPHLWFCLLSLRKISDENDDLSTKQSCFGCVNVSHWPRISGRRYRQWGVLYHFLAGTRSPVTVGNRSSPHRRQTNESTRGQEESESFLGGRPLDLPFTTHFGDAKNRSRFPRADDIAS